MEEIWKSIPGFEGKYEASNLGRVRSLIIGDGTKTKFRLHPKVLRGCGRRYLQVCFYVNRKQKSYSIHRLVLQAFIGPCPQGFQGAHLDGNQRNNSLANLCWVSPPENQQHKSKHGTMPIGTQNKSTKLTENQVREIRKLHKLGYSGNKLAVQFGVHSATIYELLRGRTWKHVK